jgi:predicted house-cleaning NTP pyrophosphatase (Maf/HAM1 superfamily)
LPDNEIVHGEAQTSITTVHFGTPSAVGLEGYLAFGESLRVAGGLSTATRRPWGEQSALVIVSIGALAA